jgi:two-component system NtrC family sensor kinase
MAFGQDTTYVLSTTSFNENGYLRLPDMTEWRFHKGSDSIWAKPNYDHSTWQKLDSTVIRNINVDENGLFECWFTIRVRLDSSFTKLPLYLYQSNSASTDVYIDGELFHSFGNTNYKDGEFMGHRRLVDLPPNIALPINQEVLISVHFVELHGALFKSSTGVLGTGSFLWLIQEAPYLRFIDNSTNTRNTSIILISILGLLMSLFWLITYLNPRQKHLLYSAFTVSFLFGNILIGALIVQLYNTSSFAYLLTLITFPFSAAAVISLVLLIASILEIRINLFLKILIVVTIVIAFASNFLPAIVADLMQVLLYGYFIIMVYFFVSRRAKLKGSKVIIVIGVTVSFLSVVLGVLLSNFWSIGPTASLILGLTYILAVPFGLLIYLAFWLKEMVQDIQDKAKKVIEVTEEKKTILENQNIVLEKQVNERTAELNASLENLKATQSQLIQSEKMASLGELTAGIAHEIQNPLNFVNNFSELNKELISELGEEIEKGDLNEIKAISEDIKNNEDKINHHGKRASAIVKSMLEHSRQGDGKKEPTELNKLADEYLRLAYHGLRAKDKSFNADFELDLDDSLPKVNVVPQDIGRVLLNLINNAFHACTEQRERASADRSVSTYQPLVTVSTKNLIDQIQITVSDNGPGIPDEIKDKIFQPFFTTKPTGEGTGLGLSMSYDIITKGHDGEIKAESQESKGTTFSIILPLKAERK